MLQVVFATCNDVSRLPAAFVSIPTLEIGRIH
jgi:hypothetical protein